MAELITPMLRAFAGFRHTTNGSEETSVDIDFSIRAPIGAVVRGWSIFHNYHSALLTFDGIITFETVISMDPDRSEANMEVAGSDNNWPVLGGLITTLERADATSLITSDHFSTWMPADLPTLALPTTFQPIRVLCRTATAIASQQRGAQVILYYQLAKFNDSEVAAFAASRP